jgi:putative membrane protein
MDLLTAKALHIIGFTCWFAGLFYGVRLFVYHAEASERDPAERDILLPHLELMQSRLWNIITVPAMWITLAAGGDMIYQRSVLEPWLHIKLGLVAVLFAYHLISGGIRRRQRARTSRWSSRGLRLWNEVATVLLVAIVFLAVKKDTLGMWSAVAGLVVLGIALMLGLRLYRALRGA